LLAELRWSTDALPLRQRDPARPLPLHPVPVFLSALKLEHDIEQLRYLRDVDALGPEADSILAASESAHARLARLPSHTRVRVDDDADPLLRAVFSRLVHVTETPRVERALSATWSAKVVEEQYLANKPGITVIDNFLSADALERLNRFCVESTIWSANRYAFGRLGAFFPDGFNCPLLMQIAEELRTEMPRVIGDRYPLRQVWAFKNRHHLPGDSTTHADFAAINVNFWITPDEANLDPDGSGLRIFDADAPLHWSFDSYNARSDVIQPFLQQVGARSTSIPYRQNRAVIFNSDLFHGTQEVRFRPGYLNRRINITMLYGDREHDRDHGELSLGCISSGRSSTTKGWRSAAFSKVRRP
jgi:hypothetical protein